MKKTKVLIVENEPLIALDVKMSLEKLGYEVTAIATSYQDALSKAYEAKPDITLMDINLDGNKDGIQTAKALKAHYNIPVVFLTSLSELDTIHRAKESDPFGYIVKPFKQDDLKSSIEIALYNHHKTSDLQGNLDKLTTAVNVMEMPLAILNENGMIDYVNSRFEKLTGWRIEDKKGGSINQMMMLEGVPAWLFIEKNSVGHEKNSFSFNGNSYVIPRSGKQIPVIGMVNFFHTPESGISGYVISMRENQPEKKDTGLTSDNASDIDLSGHFVDDYFFLKDKSSLFRIHVDQINYIEALGNYVKVNTGGRSYTALIPLKEIERILPPHKFFRIHRSYIVAVDKISAIHPTELEISDAMLPIGKTYKDDLLKKIQVI